MIPDFTQSVIDACKEFGPQLNGCVTHDGQPVDGVRLLWAIAGNESSFGQQREFVKYEPGYLPSGYYYRNSIDIKGQFRRWGVLASSSFGSFQIMYQTAREVGYKDHPILLQNDKICAQWATTLILKRFVKAQHAETLRDIFDAYNSGNSHDSIVPQEYIDKAIQTYERGLPPADNDTKAA